MTRDKGAKPSNILTSTELIHINFHFQNSGDSNIKELRQGFLIRFRKFFNKSRKYCLIGVEKKKN